MVRPAYRNEVLDCTGLRRLIGDWALLLQFYAQVLNHVRHYYLFTVAGGNGAIRYLDIYAGTCLGIDDSGFRELVRGLGEEYEEVSGRRGLVNALSTRDVGVIRRALDNAVSGLEGLGMPDRARVLASLAGEFIGQLRRGSQKYLETGARIYEVLEGGKVEYILTRLSGRYQVLDYGAFKLALEHGAGITRMPNTLLDQARVLEGLGLGVHVVEGVLDEDVVFTHVLWGIPQTAVVYRRALVRAYLALRGLDAGSLGDGEWGLLTTYAEYVPSVHRSLREGRLTYILIEGNKPLIIQYPLELATEGSTLREVIDFLSKGLAVRTHWG